MSRFKLPALVLIGLLMGLCTGCENETTTKPAATGKLVDPLVLVGDPALERVREFVELGPKVAGTPAARKAAEWIAAELIEVGVEGEIISFDDVTPRGTSTFHNVRGVIPGDPKQLLVIGCHFDTKLLKDDETFVGANDSGSGVGLLIELARVLQAEKGRRGPEIHVLFFDGEECVVHYGNNDGFHGSKYMADAYEEAGRLEDMIGIIILDMVGHDDLTITIPQNCHAHLVAKTFEASHNTGYRSHFRLYGRVIADDHTAFMNKGVPAVDLIDFAYGSAPSLNDYWHTGEDTMDKLSANSLEIVGRVTLEMVNLLHVQPRMETK